MATVSSKIQFASNVDQLKSDVLAGIAAIDAMKQSVERTNASIKDGAEPARNMAAALFDVGKKSQESGEKVSALRKYIDDLTPSTKNAHASFTDLRGTLSEMWESPTSAVKSLAGAVGTDLSGSLGAAGVAAGLTGGALLAVGVASFELAERAAKVGANLNDMNETTGISVSALSRLNNAAPVLGTSLGALTNIVFKMQQTMGEDPEKFTKGLNRIGLEFTSFKQLAPEQQLMAISSALKATEDPIERNTAGVELMGKQFRDIAPSVMKLNEGLEMTKDLNPWSDEEARQAEQFEMHMASISVHFQNMATTLGREVLPYVDHVAERVEELSHWTPGHWLQLLLSAGAGPIGLVGHGSTTVSMTDLEEQAHGVNLPTPNLPDGTTLPSWGTGFIEPGVIPKKTSIVGATDQETNKLLEGYLADAKKAADDYAHSLKNLTIAEQGYQGVLDSLGGTVVEAIKYELEHKGSVEDIARVLMVEKAAVTAVEAATKDHADALKLSDDIQKRFTTEGDKQWKDWFTSVAKNLESTNKLVVSTFEGLLKSQADYRDAVARDTLSADDYQRSQLQRQIDDAKVKLRTLGAAFQSTYDQIAATVEIKLSEIGTAWQEHPMIPPKATFDAKQQVDGVSGSLRGLTSVISQVGQLGGGSWAPIAQGATEVAVSVEHISKSMQALTTTGGFNVQNLSSIATGWLGIWTVMWQVADAIYAAQSAANKLQEQFEVSNQAALDFAETMQTNVGTSGLSHGLLDIQQFSETLDQSLRTTLDLVNRVYQNQPRDDRGAGGINLQRAEALQLVDIMKELGGVGHLTANEMNTVKTSVGLLFDMIAKGGALGQDALKSLDGTMTAFGQSAIDTHGLVDQFFLDTAAKARAAGVELKGVSDFMQGQTTAAETGISAALQITNDAYAKRKDLQSQIAALGTGSGDKAKAADLNAQLATQNQIIDASTVHSQQAADAVSGSLVGIINSQIMAGKSFHDSVIAVAPSVDALSAQMIAAGYNGSAAFDFLRGQVALVNDAVAGPALSAVEGYAAGLRGLNNAGLLDQGMFAGLSSQIGQTHDALIAQGKDGGQVLSAMRGPLQTMWELEQKFGYTTDDATQSLIDQAEKQDMVGDKFKPIGEQMLDATNRVADAVEGLAEVFGVLPKAAKDAASGISDEFSKIKVPAVKLPYTPPPWQENPIAPNPVEMAAGGFGYASGPMAFITRGNEEYAFSGEGRRFSRGDTPATVTSVDAPMTTIYEINLTVNAIDSQNMQEAVEKQILPMIVNEIEDRRRDAHMRLRRALVIS